MAPQEPGFQESLWSTPIRDLGLTIDGTRLEPILVAFQQELEQAGIRKLRPRYYLSNEWGVPFGTLSIAIPFYLARPELTAVHAEQTGLVEGLNPADVLRYLRHEMGHVVCYAYRLYEEQDWVKLFGSITQPYLEDYRPTPFSRRYVRHLPGWYAQKHPDEDWAETFAVWMTPKLDWRAEYAERPVALAKLLYCDAAMAAVAEREPAVTSTELDEDVREIGYSIEQFYQEKTPRSVEFPPGLDGALRAIFDDLGPPESAPAEPPRKSAAALIRSLGRELPANVYRWTGHFPERTRALLQQLAERAERLEQVYPADREVPATLALTTLVTALAMNYVHRGNYLP